MKPYNWMVQYTPQTNWIERRGAVIWLSMYAGILGGGAYLVSLFFDNFAGMFISWLVVVFIKGGLHLAHAERPLKLWRMILRPQTSWISRGMILTLALIVLGAIQLILSYFIPGAPVEIIFKWLTGIASFGVVIYAGFTLSYVSGIPIWNVATLPVSFIFWGIQTGASLILILGPGADMTKLAVILTGSMSTAIIIVIAFYLWTGTYEGDTARESVKELMHGTLALIMWLVAVIIGLVVPLAISLLYLMGGSMPGQLTAIVLLACSLCGGLAFTYAVLKAGVYRPIIPSRY